MRFGSGCELGDGTSKAENMCSVLYIVLSASLEAMIYRRWKMRIETLSDAHLNAKDAHGSAAPSNTERFTSLPSY